MSTHVSTLVVAFVREGCSFELFFSHDLEGLTEVFDWMSAGMSRPTLPLWLGMDTIERS